MQEAGRTGIHQGWMAVASAQTARTAKLPLRPVDWHEIILSWLVLCCSKLQEAVIKRQVQLAFTCPLMCGVITVQRC